MTGRRRLRHLSIACAASYLVCTSLPLQVFASPQTEPLLKAIDPSEAKLDTPQPPSSQYPGQSGPNPFGRVSGSPVSPGAAGQKQQGTDTETDQPPQSAPQYPSESQIPQFGQPLPPSQQGGGGNAQNWVTDQNAAQQSQASPTVDEMRITRLEKQAFGSTYPEHEVEDRVDHLEKEIFGSKSTAPMPERIARLETKLGGPGVFGQSPSAQSLAQRSVPTQAASNMYPAGSSGTPVAAWSAGPTADGGSSGQTTSSPPPQVAYAPPSSAGYNAPPQTTPSAPAQGGYTAPQQGGYTAPQQGGYPASQQGGYPAPQQGGYTAPQQGGYPAPQQGGYLAPQQGGYPAPQQGGYPAPQQGGYLAPQQGGYLAPPGYGAPAQSYPAPPQTAYAPPMVPGQGGYPVPQGGYAPPGQNPYMMPQQGYPGGYAQPQGYPPPQQAYGAAPQMGWPPQPQYQQPPGYGGWPQQPPSYPPASYNPAGRGYQPGMQTAYAGPPANWGQPQAPYSPPQPGYQPMPGSGIQPASTAPSNREPAPAPSRGPVAPNTPNPALNSTDYLTVIKGIPSDPRAGDYFNQVWRPTGTTCARWTRLPIKVHLPQSTPESWQKNLDAAVKKWGQYIPMKVAGPSEAADIEVVWESHFPQKIFGVTRLQVLQGHLQVQIYLLRPTFYPPQIPERSLQTAFLHELGHALGLFGHSETPEDVMYNSDLTGGKGKANQGVITFRDLNTLKKVYETPQQASTLTTPKPLEWGAHWGEETNSH